MTLALTQSLTAVAANITSSFLGVGGVEPYVYTVAPGGAGGTIDPSTGLYTAPAQASSSPKFAYDFVTVTDDNGDTATARILVGTALILFCDVLQQGMGLADGRVYLWDQKIFQPTDSSIYIAVSVPICKPFGNTIRPSGTDTGFNSAQYLNMLATLDINIISRGPEARDRKEEVLMAVNSYYAQQQQEANSFYIGRLPPGGRFTNLSQIDGAAIPYRYQISVNMQYTVAKVAAAQYIDTFEDVEVITNP